METTPTQYKQWIIEASTTKMRRTLEIQQDLATNAKNKSISLIMPRSTGGKFIMITHILNQIDTTNQRVQAILLMGNQDRVFKCKKHLDQVLQFSPDSINVSLIVKGHSIADCVQELEQTKPQIIIGTLGKVADLVNRGVIDTNSLKILCFLDADFIEKYISPASILRLNENIPKKTMIYLRGTHETPEIKKMFRAKYYVKTD